jgi:peptidyl-prolyl cis-trans isomerase A (cyclophilin A)
VSRSPRRARFAGLGLAGGLLIAGLLLLAAPPGLGQEPGMVRVVMQTERGDVTLALDPQRAPLTVANFLRYVDAGRFDGIEFYRAMKLDAEGNYGLVQGGAKADPKRLFEPIAHEAPAVTGLSHLDGAISMAREAPGTATADFFIIIGNLTSLDGKGEDPGYAVFGRVVEGMDVVRGILDLPRDDEAGEGAMKGQMLAPPVRILTVRRQP